jgi:hypothetical protein
VTYTRGREFPGARARTRRRCPAPPRRPVCGAPARSGRARRARRGAGAGRGLAPQKPPGAGADRSCLGAPRGDPGAGHDGGGGDARRAPLVRLPHRPRTLRAGRRRERTGSRPDRRPPRRRSAGAGSRRGGASAARRRGRRRVAVARDARTRRTASRRARPRRFVRARCDRPARDHVRNAGRRGAGGDAAAGSDRDPGVAHRPRRGRLGHHRSPDAGRKDAAAAAPRRAGGALPSALVRPDDLAASVDDDRHRRRPRRARRRRFPGHRAAERTAHPDHQPLPQGQGPLEHPRRRRDDERLRRLVGLVPGGVGAGLPDLQPAGLRVAAPAAAGTPLATGDRLAARLSRPEGEPARDRCRSPRGGPPADPAPRRGRPGARAQRGAEGARSRGAGGASGGAGPVGAGAVDPGRQRQLRARRGRSRRAPRRSHRCLFRGDRHDGAPLPALHAPAHGDLPRGRFRALSGRGHRFLRVPGPSARPGGRRGRPGDDGARPLRPRLPIGGRAPGGGAPLHDRAAGRVARQGGDLRPLRRRRAARRASDGDAEPLRHRADHPGTPRPAGVRRDAGTRRRLSARSVLPVGARTAPHPVVRDGRRAARARTRRGGSGGPRGGGGAAGEPPIARVHRRRRGDAGRDRIRRGGAGRNGSPGRCRRHAGLLPPQPRHLLPEAARLPAGDRGVAAGERPAAAPEDG